MILSSVVAALALSGCGGHGAASGRPTVDQLTAALTSGPAADMVGTSSAGVTPKVITCLAQKLEGSQLSDDALRAIVNGDKSFEGSSADNAALTDMQTQLTTCAKLPG